MPRPSIVLHASSPSSNYVIIPPGLRTCDTSLSLDKMDEVTSSQPTANKCSRTCVPVRLRPSFDKCLLLGYQSKGVQPTSSGSSMVVQRAMIPRIFMSLSLARTALALVRTFREIPC